MKWTQHVGRLLLSAAITIVFLAGCASTEDTHADHVDHKGSYHTFGITMASSGGPASDPGAVARLTTPVLESVRSSLLAKGYSEARPSEADLLVKVRAEFKPDLLTETTEQRSFIIDIVERRTGDRIWTGRRDRSSSNTLDPDMVQKTIVDLLAPFPNASAAAVH